MIGGWYVISGLLSNIIVYWNQMPAVHRMISMDTITMPFFAVTRCTDNEWMEKQKLNTLDEERVRAAHVDFKYRIAPEMKWLDAHDPLLYCISFQCRRKKLIMCARIPVSAATVSTTTTTKTRSMKEGKKSQTDFITHLHVFYLIDAVLSQQS